jgi:Holliday junction resolvase
MPLEKTIVSAITKEAAGLGWMVIKIHGGPFQNKGIPDLLCLRGGRAVWLEVKQPGKKPTPIQWAMMRRLEAEGGTPCFVVTSKAEAREFLTAAT